MRSAVSKVQKQVLSEVAAVPEEYMPFLLQMIRSYRESIALGPAKDSFARGWAEARRGATFHAKHLWEGIDV